MKLTNEEKEYILDYLDYMNGGTFNEDIMEIIGYSDEKFEKEMRTKYKIPNNVKHFDISSADFLLYILNCGIQAVENGILTYNQLIGKEKIVNNRKDDKI